MRLQDETDDFSQSKGSIKKCAFIAYGENPRRTWSEMKQKVQRTADDGSWVGQVRSFNLNGYCMADKNGKITIDPDSAWAESGYDYRTVLAYCESQNYQAVNNAKQAAYNQNILNQAKEKQKTYGTTQWDSEEGLVYVGDEDQTKAYNQDILGLQYNSNDEIINPFGKATSLNTAEEDGTVLTCDDNGTLPDANGCCPGETFTDMGPDDPNSPDGPHTFACCPSGDGDCFPPIEVE